MRIVVALGGNAFNKPGEPFTQETHVKNIRRAAEVVAKIVKEGNNVVVTHGNGPQVGFFAELQQVFMLDALTAATQGLLGYFITSAIDSLLGPGRSVAMTTRVEVDCRDPAFKNATKFIGPLYTREEAEALSIKHRWEFRQDPRGGWRRVVPSPMPLRVVEIEVIKKLVDSSHVVVAVGGGGVPICDGVGVEAVVDKDLASTLLALEIGADLFIVLTDIDGVYLNYGKPHQKKLDRVKVGELERYHTEGHFPPGSMGPKVQAAIQFVKLSKNRAAIGSIEEGYRVYRGDAGTQIYP